MLNKKISIPSSNEREFETQYNRLCRQLPIFTREFKFHPNRKWRFDFAWPEYRFAVEIDGGVFSPGGGRHAKDGDRDKLNAAALMGWTVLRYSSQQLKNDPMKIMNEIASILQKSPE